MKTLAEVEAERVKHSRMVDDAFAAIIRSHRASADHEQSMADAADDAKKRASHRRRARRYAAKADRAARCADAAKRGAA